MPVVVKSSFIGDFKLGDNIKYNLDALDALYIAQKTTQNGQHGRALCKPITIISISIVEALLDDLHFKARHFSKEGVKGVLDDVLVYIRGKKLDKLEHLLNSAKKHSLLGDNEELYAEIDQLRVIRNRLHIQNRPPKLDPNEYNVFTPHVVVRCEKAVERVMKYMEANHVRPHHTHGYVPDFVLPWEPHFPA